MGEKFNLTWHTFSSHGQELFKNLLETQEFTDVTLISDDHHQYRVHKFILSACSTALRKILTSNPLNSILFLNLFLTQMFLKSKQHFTKLFGVFVAPLSSDNYY